MWESSLASWMLDIGLALWDLSQHFFSEPCVCVSACLCPCVCVGYRALKMGIAHMPQTCQNIVGFEFFFFEFKFTRQKKWCLVFPNFPYFQDNYSYYFYCSQPIFSFFCPGLQIFSRPRELFHGRFFFQLYPVSEAFLPE